MAKATIRDYGKVDFDPMCPGNNFYDLYAVAICDPETDQIIGEEHYTDEDDFRTACNDVAGREVMNEGSEMGFCSVSWFDTDFECECTYHVAYVFDSED